MTDPAELLKQLSANADPRKVKSLKIIHEVCEEQRRRGSFDFSLAAIGRLSSEKGGPAAGAIRNTTGEAYRALIKAHLDAAGGKKPKGKPHKADENPFEGITDPVLRARIGILLAENESLRGQLQAARHLANTQSVVGLPNSQSNVTPTPQQFSEQELRAIEHAISNSNLEAQGWVKDTNGRINDEFGRNVFKAGFSNAIQKILGLKQ